MTAKPETVYPWYEKLPFPLRNAFRIASDITYYCARAKYAWDNAHFNFDIDRILDRPEAWLAKKFPLKSSSQAMHSRAKEEIFTQTSTTNLGVNSFGRPYVHDEGTFATYEYLVKCGDAWRAHFHRAPGNFPAEGIHVDDHGSVDYAGHYFRLALDEVRSRCWSLDYYNIRPSQSQLALAALTLQQNLDYEARHNEDPPNVIRFPT